MEEVRVPGDNLAPSAGFVCALGALRQLPRLIAIGRSSLDVSSHRVSSAR